MFCVNDLDVGAVFYLQSLLQTLFPQIDFLAEQEDRVVNDATPLEVLLRQDDKRPMAGIDLSRLVFNEFF